MSVAVLFTLFAGVLVGAAWFEYRKARRLAQEMREERERLVAESTEILAQATARQCAATQESEKEEPPCHS